MPAPRYIMSIILPSYQHCNEQQFKHSHVHFTQFSSNKDIFIHISTVTILHAFLLWKKIRVRLACILFSYKNQYFKTFLRQNIQQKVLAFQRVLNFSWEHAPNPVASVQIQYYIIIVT